MSTNSIVDTFANANQQGVQDSLMLRALKGLPVPRPAVWMMRQAGRFLPDYQKLRAKYSFFERVETPELATEITLMPVEQLGVDAAIIFSDILVIPQALDIEVQMIQGVGPVIPQPIRSIEQIDNITQPDVADRLHHVMDALRLTRKQLPDHLPLIGFAGSPWTIFCYMVEGKGSKNFATAKAFAFSEPEAAEKLLDLIAESTIDYLKAQVEAGANVIQIFDSWGGLLSPEDYHQYSLPWIQKIVKAVTEVPVIVFAKGCWFALDQLAQSGAKGLGIDWNTSPQTARQLAGPDICLQGNLDPSRLMSPIPQIQAATKKMITDFGTQRYIVNLGHGILPNIPVDHAKAFIESVKQFGS